MSYAATIREKFLEPAGALVPEISAGSVASPEVQKVWQSLWQEIFRDTQSIRALHQNSTSVAVSFAVEAMPIAEEMIANTTAALLIALEKLFGDSATDLAKMLRVTRPMVYHYREGMEPTVEKKRRLSTLATLASEWDALATEPLKGTLKAPQPGGRTLLEFLSDEKLDVTVLRQMLWRSIQASDQMLRNRLANALGRNESSEARADVARARRSEGKPIYVGDPNAPGKLIQILPDGNRIRGRMVKRRFVPDEE